MKKFLLALIIFATLSAPLSVSAGVCTFDRSTASGSSESRIVQFPKCISSIYIWSLGVAGVLALLMATAGGFTYMTAAGNAEKTQKGTEMIWGAVIGLALLFGAYLLLNTINPNLVNFDLSAGTCFKDGKATEYKNESSCNTAGGKWYGVGESAPAPSPRN